MLKAGGLFYCGTDFYSDNHLTKRWTKVMKIPMDLRSKAEWKKMFKKAGFQDNCKAGEGPKTQGKVEAGVWHTVCYRKKVPA